MTAIKMLKLDYLTMKPHLRTFSFMVLFVMIFLSVGSSITLILINISWYIALVAANIFAVEEKHNMGRLYGTLALNLRSIVLGRYLFILSLYLVTLCSVIIFVGLIPSLFPLSGNPLIIEHFLLSTSLSFLIFSLIVSGQLPLYFKMGYNKARIMSIIPFLLLFGLAALINYIDPLGVLNKVLSNEMGFSIFFVFCGIVVMMASYMVSLKIKNKQK